MGVETLRAISVRVNTLNEKEAIKQAMAHVPDSFKYDKSKVEFIKAHRIVRFHAVVEASDDMKRAIAEAME